MKFFSLLFHVTGFVTLSARLVAPNSDVLYIGQWLMRLLSQAGTLDYHGTYTVLTNVTLQNVAGVTWPIAMLSLVTCSNNPGAQCFPV